MTLALAAVLIIGGFVLAFGVAVLTPLMFGLMAYDVATRERKPRRVEDASMRIAVERGVARAFVLAGGSFWAIASFAGLYSFRQSGMREALLAAFMPLVACAVTIVVGWYFERLTAVLLLVASLAVVVWGVIYQFELGVWMIMTFALIGPMLTAAVLFWLARRNQDAFELATALRPELALVFAARSTII